MFHPLPVYVGLRYARARAHRFFVSFITWVSLLGVCVGVAALIVILSVMNGFESGAARAAAGAVRAGAGDGPAWHAPGLGGACAEDIAARLPGATVERYAEMQVLAVRQPEMLPLQLRGADQAMQAASSASCWWMASSHRMAQGEGLVLGRQVAEQLGLAVGDTVHAAGAERRQWRAAGSAAARVHGGGTVRGRHPGQRRHAGLCQPAGAAMRSAPNAAAMRVWRSTSATRWTRRWWRRHLQPRLQARWPGLVVSDWTQEHASYFRAIRIEKTMMALILLLIVAVAAFNIVAMLVMVVTDKRTDIAILRTFGASPRAVAGVFLVAGPGHRLAGRGGRRGCWALRSPRTSVPSSTLLNHYTGLTLFDADVYYFTDVPSELHRLDVLLVAGSALAGHGAGHCLSGAARGRGCRRPKRCATSRRMALRDTYEWLIGTRYLRSGHRRGFLSFITGISIAGLAVGVAVLLIVMSVMNGFEKELRSRILQRDFACHVEWPGGDPAGLARGAAAGAGNAGRHRGGALHRERRPCWRPASAWPARSCAASIRCRRRAVHGLADVMMAGSLDDLQAGGWRRGPRRGAGRGTGRQGRRQRGGHCAGRHRDAGRHRCRA